MRFVTAIFIACSLLSIAVYDVIALIRGGGRATISSVTLAAVYTPPYGALIPLFIGMLVIHLITGKP